MTAYVASQASVPAGLTEYGDTLPYENEDKLLWDPKVEGNDTDAEKKDKELELYLARSQDSLQGSGTGVASMPLGAHVRDDEQVQFCDPKLRRCPLSKFNQRKFDFKFIVHFF